LSYEFIDETTGVPKSNSTASTIMIEPSENQEVESYEIYLEFLLGPIEMFKKRVSKFSINFTGQENAFISVNEINLYTAKYIDVKYEWINVWERKYVASEFKDVTGDEINLDSTDDYLHYQEDNQNSGQYFRFRTGELQDLELAALDKTKTVACGVRYTENESIDDISYDNLHDIEAEEQKILYKYAYDLDPSGNVLYYESVTPYKYKNFLDELEINFAVSGLTITSEKLPWELNSLYKQFKQYDYWRPGGHFYRWNSKFTKEKCMLFGPAHNYYDAYYAHVDHTGVGTPLEVDASRPIDALNSYYSLRFYTQQAKYDRAMILGGGEPEFGDRISGVIPFNVPLVVNQ
jgi:hypothetical protein